MEWLYTWLDHSSIPALTAFILGLLTALSPCPLATNVVAIGYISKQVEDKRQVFRNGLLYTLGRIIAYTLLGIVLIWLIRQGSGRFGLQHFIAEWGQIVIGPLLLLIGLLMLFGIRLPLSGLGFNAKGEQIARKGSWGALLLGVLFALAFCPSSGIFYFGMLIPLSASTSGGMLLPVVFAIATALPVLVVAWVLAFSVRKIGVVYGKMQMLQRWMNRMVGLLFVLIGIYYCIIIFF